MAATVIEVDDFVTVPGMNFAVAGIGAEAGTVVVAKIEAAEEIDLAVVAAKIVSFQIP